MIGKMGDNAVILLAAILTICGFALLFLPWGALSIGSHDPGPTLQTQQKDEIVVGIGKPSAPQKPHNP